MGVQKNRRPTIAPDSDGAYQDVAGGGGGGGAGALDRTAVEQDAGFTNLAGDAVYQITVEIAAGPANEALNIPHGITGMKKLIKCEGFLDNGSFWRSINNLEATITANLHWALSDTNFILVSGTGSDYSLYSGEVTIFYTKTA